MHGVLIFRVDCNVVFGFLNAAFQHFAVGYAIFNQGGLNKVKVELAHPFGGWIFIHNVDLLAVANDFIAERVGPLENARMVIGLLDRLADDLFEQLEVNDHSGFIEIASNEVSDLVGVAMDVVAAFFGVGGRIVETMGGLELDSRFEFVHDDVSSVGELEVIICYASAVVKVVSTHSEG